MLIPYFLSAQWDNFSTQFLRLYSVEFSLTLYPASPNSIYFVFSFSSSVALTSLMLLEVMVLINDLCTCPY
jgi:hypothetical protein